MDAPITSPQPTKAKRTPKLKAKDQPPAPRNGNGTWVKGFSGRNGADVGRARRDLNGATIAGMREAFDKYGKAAIEKVAKQQPAIFLKLLVLLVPRELEITRGGGVQAMSDEQIEAAIQAIEDMLARRAGEQAKVIEASPVLPSAAPVADKPDGSEA